MALLGMGACALFAAVAVTRYTRAPAEVEVVQSGKFIGLIIGAVTACINRGIKIYNQNARALPDRPPPPLGWPSRTVGAWR